MGSGASKQAGKAAAGAKRRQYPSTSSIMNSASSTSNAPSYQTPLATAAAQARPDPAVSPPTDSKEAHIDLDGRDPQFGSALKRLGPAIAVERAAPNKSAFPTSSQPPLGQQGANIFPSSRSPTNSALTIVHTRTRIAQKYDEEMEALGRPSFKGRTLISAKDIREVIRMRDLGGLPSDEIEKQMRLRPGILDQLAQQGVYANV